MEQNSILHGLCLCKLTECFTHWEVRLDIHENKHWCINIPTQAETLVPQLIIFLADPMAGHLCQSLSHLALRDYILNLQLPINKNLCDVNSNIAVKEFFRNDEKSLVPDKYERTYFSKNCMLLVKPITTIQCHEELTSIWVWWASTSTCNQTPVFES